MTPLCAGGSGWSLRTSLLSLLGLAVLCSLSVRNCPAQMAAGYAPPSDVREAERARAALRGGASRGRGGAGPSIAGQRPDPIPSASLPELDELKLGFLALFEGAGVRRLRVDQVSRRFPDTRHWVLGRHEDPALWDLLASGIRRAQLASPPALEAGDDTRFTIWESAAQGERVHVVLLRDGRLCSASPHLGAMARTLEVGPEFFEALARLADRPRITTYVLPAEEVSQRLLRDTPVSVREALTAARHFARTCGIGRGEDVRVAARLVCDGQRSAITRWQVTSDAAELEIDAHDAHPVMVFGVRARVVTGSDIRDEDEALARAIKLAEAMGAGALARELPCRIGQGPHGLFWTASWDRTVGGEALPSFLQATLSSDGARLHAFRQPWPRRRVHPITADDALAAGRRVASEILGVGQDELEIMSWPRLFALDGEHAAQLAARIPKGGPQPVPVWELQFDSAGRGHAALYLSAEDGRVLEVDSYSPPHRGDRDATPRSSSASRRERDASRKTDSSLYLLLAVVGAFALVGIVLVLLRTSPRRDQ